MEEASYNAFRPEYVGNLKKVKERVAYILEHKPACKGNDALLTWYYHFYFDDWRDFVAPGKFYEAWERIRQSTSPETVTRMRRKLQEGGEYLPSNRVRAKRTLREQAIREGIHEL